MNGYLSGMVAGFFATVALSILMVLKSMMGLMPQLDVISMLAEMTGMGTFGGWLIHFLIGTVAWGVLFAALIDVLPGEAVVKGLVFGALAWLAMMIVVMPMAGAGFFGMGIGIMAPIATLVLHLVYGAVLGWTFDWASRRATADA